MTIFPRAGRRLALLLPLVLLNPQTTFAQEPAPPTPEYVTAEGDTPWIYEGSDVPRDEEWTFGEMPNGLRYAVRKNGVPPDQVSIRVRVDTGSLYEQDGERGYAHLLEHLLFRESKYLKVGEAIPTWQRLGATFGSDTNAHTSFTETVYKLDLPNVDPAKFAESMKILSGMVREPVLSDTNVNAEVPIVLAEKRERGGAGERAADRSRETLFAGQPLAARSPIGTEASLNGASGNSVGAFYKRWYRPENVVIAIAGDLDPMLLAAEIERWFGDWTRKDAPAPAPSFGDPVAPSGATGENPVGEVAVVVEPDLPRQFTYAYLRPWREKLDTIAYNEGNRRDELALALINRRLEARARSGGSYLSAQVMQGDFSRSANVTIVSFAPLTDDWQSALTDIRAVIADAIANPPTAEELERELSEFEVDFASMVEQREVMPGSALADTVTGAVDIREAVAAPEIFLQVFNSMRATLTPELVREHTEALFAAPVVRAVYVTPSEGEADEQAIRQALQSDITPDGSARIAASSISFADLPPIGEPGTIERQGPIGVLDIQRVDFANGVKAVLWSNDAEPGRVAVKVRFGAGYRGFSDEDAAYVTLGESALVASGQGELGQEDLDRISTGRRMGYTFEADDGAFSFFAQTRAQDLNDQLYLFANKLSDPRWDPNPVLRSKAAAKLTYESYSASPGGVLSRDLEYLLRDSDPRYRTPTPEQIDAATPEGFRKVWEPLLAQGPVEVFVFGEFDTAETIEALRRTFGALQPRQPLAPDVVARSVDFPEAGETVVRYHRGDANQAAAVIAWPSGAGVGNLRESRQLEILTQVFSNRLLDAMRERAGASYAPVVNSSWPTDIDSGGRIAALAQLRPQDVPAFFEAADKIARDLATTPPDADELQRVTEPLRQYINRASTGNLFWLFQLEGATQDARRVGLVRSLLADYSETTPERMLALAQKYFGGKPGWRMAVIPEGQDLATRVPAGATNAGR